MTEQIDILDQNNIPIIPDIPFALLPQYTYNLPLEV